MIICDRDQEKLHLAKIKSSNLDTFKCDISKDNERKDLFQYIKSKYGKLNVLINNAAIMKKIDFAIDNNELEFEKVIYLMDDG